MRSASAAPLLLSNEHLSRVGARLGAGAIVAFPGSACGLQATAGVARYLAEESAGQCGPCVYGLAASSEALERLVRGEAERSAELDLARILRQLEGRGACRHPDGAAHFVASAMKVFSDEVSEHLAGRCRLRSADILPVTAGRRR